MFPCLFLCIGVEVLTARLAAVIAAADAWTEVGEHIWLSIANGAPRLPTVRAHNGVNGLGVASRRADMCSLINKLLYVVEAFEFGRHGLRSFSIAGKRLSIHGEAGRSRDFGVPFLPIHGYYRSAGREIPPVPKMSLTKLTRSLLTVYSNYFFTRYRKNPYSIYSLVSICMYSNFGCCRLCSAPPARTLRCIRSARLLLAIPTLPLSVPIPTYNNSYSPNGCDTCFINQTVAQVRHVA